tara:strand:- start:510 stop:833 length:324 start_codon:yes stop_codon:yes gene_type:complete
MQLTRFSTDQEDVTVATAIADSDEIDYGEFARGQIHVPSGSSITTLTFHTSHKPGGDYEAAYDSSNAAVTMTVAADRSYPIPVDLIGARVFKMTGDAAGTVHLSLKG